MSSVGLHDLFTFFTIAHAIYSIAICWYSFKKLHNELQRMQKQHLNASNRQMLFGDLSHISKLSTSELAPSSILSISSLRYQNNSSLSSSVTLSVSYSSPSDSAMSSLCCFLRKAATMLLPLSVLNYLLHGISHSATIL